MTSTNLSNLAKIGKLKPEPGDQKEFDGLLRLADIRLKDVQALPLSLENKFDLAYNASHALSLAALRWHGYRSDNRYMAFECLEHTLDVDRETREVLLLCHRRRNLAEYEGSQEIEEQLVADLIRVTEDLLRLVRSMGQVPAGTAHR